MTGTPKHIVRGKPLTEWARTLGLSYSVIALYYRNGTLEGRIDGTYKTPPLPDRTKHFVRGKSIKEWAAILGIPVVTAHWRFRRGELEAVIDGTHVSTRFKRINGLTYQEIANKLGREVSTVYEYLKDGTLDRRLAGETIPRNTPPPRTIIDGMTTADCMKALGVTTRERVRQLKNKGLLADRLAGVDCCQKARERRRQATVERRAWIRSQRLPGESPGQLAKRIDIPYVTVKLAFPNKTPFAAERRALRTGNPVARLDSDKAIADQRLPGESVEQFSRRIGMDAALVRRACGGKVPFAAERRILEAQRIIEEATNGPKD